VFTPGDTIQHRNGDLYKVVFGPDIVRLEADRAPAYAYTAVNGDGTLWVRAASKMDDGRFTLVKHDDGAQMRLPGLDERT